LYYQLEHCTLRVGVERQNVMVWFGCAGKRVAELKNEERFAYTCELCGHDLDKAHWVGKGRMDGGQWWLKSGEADFYDERGVPNFVFEDGG
jgi:hypothetical protein